MARIGLFGQPVRATVFGKVAMVRRIGRPSLPPGVEIHLDRASVPAARFLALVASGEPVTFQVRAPRYALERPVHRLRPGTKVEARTITLSEGGCSIAWPGGDPPTPGELLVLRLGNELPRPLRRRGGLLDLERRAREEPSGARIVSEGRGGRAWQARLRSPRRPAGAPTGVRTVRETGP